MGKHFCEQMAAPGHSIGGEQGRDIPPRPPLPSSCVQWGDHRLSRRGALPQLARALWPWAGLHLGRACRRGQAHHVGCPSVSDRWARPSQLLNNGDMFCPSHPWVPGPPSLTVLLHRLRIGPGDVLTFYDGDDLTARVLGQYSGPRGHFKLFTSMADVTIQFQSDPGTSVLGYQQGFVIHFFGELAPAPPHAWERGDARMQTTNHSKSESPRQ